VRIEFGDGSESFIGEGVEASVSHFYLGGGPFTIRGSVIMRDGTAFNASETFEPGRGCLP